MQSDVSYRLVVRRGPQPNQPYPLTRDTVTIGRDITNDIVINDPEVSRHHTRLVRTSGGYTVEDLRSTNGTFVNRQQLTGPRQLVDGDIVGMGETVTLAFEVLGGASAATIVGAGGQPAQPMAPPPPPPVQQYQPAPPPMSPPIQTAPGYAPPAPSRPIADEEEFEGPDRNRMIIIGCGVLTVLFCCAVVVGLIAIDSLDLWCDLPIPFLTEQLFECPVIP